MMDLKGCFTAIVTPFKGTGAKTPVDLEAYRELIAFQDASVAGIVACGTTGESPTLSHREHAKVIQVTAEESKGITIAGTGSNCTWEAIKMSEEAEEVGAQASLQVCPYYNKPNQEGLFRHFGAVAEAIDMPIILYNIPGRSGREIAPKTMARLAEEYSNVIGVKEASGDERVWKEIREECGKKFLILSGNDGDTYQLMKDYGAKGVISVASNVIPKLMADFIKLGLEGNFAEMEKENARLKEFFEVLFIDTNPIPVKAAMELAGLKGGGLRLPMCELDKEKREKVREVLEKLL